MKYNLSTFSLVACAFDLVSKKPLLNPWSQKLTMFSSKSFCPYIKVLDPFWVNFACGMRQWVYNFNICLFLRTEDRPHWLKLRAVERPQ